MNGKTSLSLHAHETGLPADAPNESGARPAILEFVRYFVASAGALGVDVGLYRLGLSFGWNYLFAALLGFCAGAGVAYVASVRWVFHARAVHNTGLEFGLFIAVGVAGLLLTELLLWVAIGTLGLPPLWAKLGTSVVVFAFNFILRKVLLFSTQAANRQGQGAVQVLVERAP
jgi:putative flippase GtrA